MAFEHWYCEKCKAESTVRYRKGDSVWHVRNLIGTQHGKKSMTCANRHGLNSVRVGLSGGRVIAPMD